MSASEDMTNALLDLATQHQLPPCAGSSGDLWMSDQRGLRAAAARYCAGCPVLDICSAYAAEVKPSHGVWAGRDWTPRPRKARTK